PRGGRPGRSGSLDPRKRNNERNALHRRWPTGSARGLVHGLPQRRSFQPRSAASLPTPEGQVQTAQGRVDGGDAQTLDLYEPSTQTPCLRCASFRRGQNKMINSVDKIDTVAGLICETSLGWHASRQG